MTYLRQITLPTSDDEYNIISGLRNIFNNIYPLNIFPKKELQTINFTNITILYGENGSGKTTLLNIIAQKINASRKQKINLGEIFDKYVERCNIELTNHINEIKLLSSDDIFERVLEIKAINTGVNQTKINLTNEWLTNKFANKNNTSIENYEEIKNIAQSKRQTQSQYIRNRLMNNTIIGESNGETSLEYYEKEINENAIYLIDEPENSLSAENQLKLKKYIEDSARFYNCQFIISTHSPFILSLNEATIYNLDNTPAQIEKWTDLPNVKTYYNFFKENQEKFK